MAESDSDSEFLDFIEEQWDHGNSPNEEDFARLFALARKGAAQNDTVLDLLGQVGQLSDELSLAAARIEALEAENARLREALEKINGCSAQNHIRFIARAALEESSDD